MLGRLLFVIKKTFEWTSYLVFFNIVTIGMVATFLALFDWGGVCVDVLGYHLYHSYFPKLFNHFYLIELRLPHLFGGSGVHVDRYFSSPFYHLQRNLT